MLYRTPVGAGTEPAFVGPFDSESHLANQSKLAEAGRRLHAGRREADHEPGSERQRWSEIHAGRTAGSGGRLVFRLRDVRPREPGTVRRRISGGLEGEMVRAVLQRASQNSRVRDWLGRSGMARRAVSRFMPGEALADALAAAAGMAAAGVSTLLTLLGEDVTDRKQADAITRHYLDALTAISERHLPANPSIKLTQLGLGVDNVLLEANLDQLAGAAADVGRLVWIDMEGSGSTAATVEVYRRLRERHDNVGLCLQAYLRRTPSDLNGLLPLRPRIRLVKGAYKEPPEIAFQSRREVSSAYRQIALRLLEETGRGHPPPTLATHDIKLLKSILATAEVARDCYDIAMLYGIRSADLLALVAEGHRGTVLISYGSEWAAWYLRRLAERPANLMFGITAALRK